MTFEEKYKAQANQVEFSGSFHEVTCEKMRQALTQKEDHSMKKVKPVKIIVIAALIAALALTAGAVARFVIPDRFAQDMTLNLDSVRTVIDTGKATEDTVSTVRKSFSNKDFTVTFEAIADGGCLRDVFTENGEAIDRNPTETYAIFTVKRTNGTPVLYSEDGKGLTPGDIGYILLVKGYAANPNLFADCYGIGLYEENNVLYVACNITDANLFADEDLYIGFTNRMVINCDILRMDKNNEYHYVDGYDGIPALFDFDLDDSRADHEKAEQYKAERPFMTYDEFEKALAEEN